MKKISIFLVISTIWFPIFSFGQVENAYQDQDKQPHYSPLKSIEEVYGIQELSSDPWETKSITSQFQVALMKMKANKFEGRILRSHFRLSSKLIHFHGKGKKLLKKKEKLSSWTVKPGILNTIAILRLPKVNKELEKNRNRIATTIQIRNEIDTLRNAIRIFKNNTQFQKKK